MHICGGNTFNSRSVYGFRANFLDHVEFPLRSAFGKIERGEMAVGARIRGTVIGLTIDVMCVWVHGLPKCINPVDICVAADCSCQ